MLLPWAIYAVLLPTLLAVLLALPFWLKRRMMLGNIFGSILVVLIDIVLIWQQYGVMVQNSDDCNQTGLNCVTDGNMLFVPYLITVALGWLDVFLLLIFSGIIEDRLKKRWLPRQSL